MQFEIFLLLLRSLRYFEKSLFHRNLIMYILVFHIRFYLNVTGSDSKNFLFYLGNIEETHKHMPLTLTDDYIAGTYIHNSYFFFSKSKQNLFLQLHSEFVSAEIANDGRVKLTLDMGAGIREIYSHSPITYNQWHELIVDRR